MRLRKKTRPSLKLYFAVTFSLLLPLLIVGCGQKKIPRFDGKIYSVDTEAVQFVRAQDDERIDIEGSELHWIAMTEEDFELFVNVYIVGCKEYPESVTLTTIDQQAKEHLN